MRFERRILSSALRLARVFAAAATLGGCAATGGTPVMHNAQIMPAQLKPGDTAVITVQVQDKFRIVRRVEGVVKEDQTIKFEFTDSGVTPDAEAGDGIWTIQVDVPFNAPPGTFEFEVSGYDSNDKLIVVDDENNEAAPLTTSFTLDIQYPEDPAAATSPNAE